MNHSRPTKVSIALLASGTLMAIVAQMFMALPAKADCVYEGKSYPVGTRIGPLICMPDNSWQNNG
jgi:hypothetical protein